jgi:hypothetical protein
MARHSGKRSTQVLARAGTLLAIALVATVQLATPAPTNASAVCPPPTSLAQVISADATEVGPLTEAFRPIVGVYAEAAAACWERQDIELTGFVAGPEGIGGVRTWAIEPRWLIDTRYFLSTTDAKSSDGWAEGPFFPVAVPAKLEAKFASFNGHWVVVTGHFNDKVAKTCVAEGDPAAGPVPTTEEAIAICRTAFVVTAIEPLVVPNTDTMPTASGASSNREANWLAIASVAVLAFGLFLGKARRRGA